MTKSTILSYVYPQLISTHKSEHNTLIYVYLLSGKYFVSVDKLTQSGGLVTKIWRKVVDHAAYREFVDIPPQNILILGLGAGSAVAHIVEIWPQSTITGVEIDSVMIDVGRQYFDLDSYKQLSIVNTDSFVWLEKEIPKYDLVLIDMYMGQELPKKGDTKQFINSIKSHLTKKGVAVFNRLSVKNQRQKNLNFLELLNQDFSHVERIKTPVNQVYAVKV